MTAWERTSWVWEKRRENKGRAWKPAWRREKDKWEREEARKVYVTGEREEENGRWVWAKQTDTQTNKHSGVLAGIHSTQQKREKR